MAPPEIPHSYPIVTPITPLLSPISPKHHHLKPTLHHKCCRGGRRMKLAKRKLIPVLVFVLCGASIFRFLNIRMINNFSVNLPPLRQHICSSTSPGCGNNVSHPQPPTQGRLTGKNKSSLTRKEARFLNELLLSRVPCNILIFGQECEYLDLAKINARGSTIVLEDSRESTNTVPSLSTNNVTRVFKITYNTVANEAYQLLKVARENPNCSPKIQLQHPTSSKLCNLALSNLPKEVYDTSWDVVVVDGPRGNSPDSPGRVSSIYTASILARRGNTSHVIVHDVDRTIEKWFSWEFLCEENLVSSKERFHHFQIQGAKSADKFCPS